MINQQIDQLIQDDYEYKQQNYNLIVNLENMNVVRKNKSNRGNKSIIKLAPSPVEMLLAISDVNNDIHDHLQYQRAILSKWIQTGRITEDKLKQKTDRIKTSSARSTYLNDKPYSISQKYKNKYYTIIKDQSIQQHDNHPDQNIQFTHLNTQHIHSKQVRNRYIDPKETPNRLINYKQALIRSINCKQGNNRFINPKSAINRSINTTLTGKRSKTSTKQVLINGKSVDRLLDGGGVGGKISSMLTIKKIKLSSMLQPAYFQDEL